MALQKAIRGSRFRGQSITWSYEDGTSPDLSSATLTGRKRNLATNLVTDITGTLEVDEAISHRFSWTYSAADVGVAGTFEIQFSAMYPDTREDKTYIAYWEVLDSL